MLMSGGKTSKAAQHLNKAHGIGSDKTASEVGKNRVKKNSPYCETLRIINNNLPFRIGEYDESLLFRDLEDIRVALNAKVIYHAVVELYDATKRQVEVMLTDNRIGAAKSFSIVADFWSAPTMSTKFLGLRLYLVDSSFQFKSVLLGTRHFAPQYGERDGGIRGPFYRWIGDVLTDFGLSRHDLLGSTSDDGPDVRWKVTTGRKLSWEWCVPHVTHVATKTAFGIVAGNNRSKNPAMAGVLRRVVKTVYQTQHVEVMGTLFRALRSLMADDDVNTRQPLNFRIHRFLGFARAIRGILLWDPLVAWNEDRTRRAQRDNVVPPAAFPLARDKTDLIQLRMSLLDGDRKIMKAVDTQPTSPGIIAPPPGVVFSKDIIELFAETTDKVVPPPAETRNAMHTQRVDEELDRWLMTPTSFRAVRPRELEPVLSYWKRQQGNLRLLPLGARVLFSMPSLSA